MSLPRRKTHVVNFRLSEDEYKKLQRFCTTQTDQSISEVARSALDRFIDSEAMMSTNALAIAIVDLTGKVHKLEQDLHRVSKLVESNQSL